MKEVKFIFFEGRSFGSKLIKWFTRSKFSHVGLYINPHEIYEVYHLKHHLLKMTWHQSNLLAHTPFTKYVVLSLCVSDEQYDTIMRFIKNLCKHNVNYDWKSIIYFVIKKKTKHNNKYFCSEGCMEAIKKAFPARFNDINSGEISPAVFYIILKAMGAKVFKIGRT